VEINADVPTYFYWKYFMNIDVTTSEGERVKQYIINAMETYSVEKPEDAYELRMAGLIMPHAAFYEYFGTSNDIRILGFRNDESPTPHLKNVLFPHEPNPIMGFNGVAMYATEWGWSVAVASIRILKRMEDEYELDNSSIFIPNATGMEYIVKITEMAIQEGLDITKRGIKIMVENAKMMRGRFIYKEQKLLLDGELDQWKLIAPSLIDYRAQLKESLGKPVEFTMSFGFNDFGNSYTGGDTRHLKMPDRGYLGDNHTTEEIEDFMDLCAKYDIACYSCGLPEWGLQVSMMKKRAASIGLPVGLKMVKAINQLSKVEKLLLN